MAQTGYTPISLYYSTTAAAVPVNTNLASGELAINITDGKLYYKDNGGTVRLLASNATSAPVLSFQTSLSGLTPSTATSGAVTLAGTLGVASGGTGLTAGTSGGILGYTATGTLASSVALTANALVLGAGAGATPTPMASLGTTTTVLHGNASGAPTFGAVSLTADVTGTLPTANGGTNLTSFTSGGVVYASSSSALATGSALTFNGSQLNVSYADTAYNAGLIVTNTTNNSASQAKIYAVNNAGDYISLGRNSTLLGGQSAIFATGNYPLEFYTDSTLRMTLTSTSLYTASGINVGFGTSSTSSARLTVAGVSNTGYTSFLANGTGTAYNLWRMTNTGGDLRIGIESATAVGILTGTTNYSSSIGTLTATDLQFGTNSTVRATIDSAGNVGIGTSSPLIPLQINSFGGLDGNGNQFYLSNNSYYDPTDARDESIKAGYSHRIVLDNNAGGILFQTTSTSAAGANTAITLTERARITSGGYFKASNNGSYLQSTSTYHELKSDVDDSTLVVFNTNASFANDIVQARVSRNTTNGSFKTFSYYNDGAGAFRFQVLDSGNVQNTNNSYGAISDVKLKENIIDASSKLNDLMQVRVRNFNFKGDQTHKQIGVIAQELEQVFPALVEEIIDRDEKSNDLGTTTKSVKYSVFVPMLIKAIQEQQAIIESLKARLDAANL